jgi:hypothetical protein
MRRLRPAGLSSETSDQPAAASHQPASQPPASHTPVGDSKRAAEVVRTLSGKRPSFSSKAPTRAPKRVQQPDGSTKTEWSKGEELTTETLAAEWRDFAAQKFAATSAEDSRPDHPDLGHAARRKKDTLSRREKETALRVLKKMKALGRDGIPIELYQKCPFCRERLFELIDRMWQYELAPPEMLQTTCRPPAPPAEWCTLYALHIYGNSCILMSQTDYEIIYVCLTLRLYSYMTRRGVTRSA